MDALKKPQLRHLSQVAADRVFRYPHLLAYLFGNHPALALEDGENLLLAVSG
jgi:hypothetical protein